MIVVVDYGMGNLGSIVNMVRKIGHSATISADPEVIGRAEKLILPGVGSFDRGMRSLEERELVPVLRDRVMGQGTPILGICLGMQLLSQGSEEGTRPGLGWISARTVRFRFPGAERRLPVPHMGWNIVKVTQPSPLFEDAETERRFYFVHSFHVECDREDEVLARTPYGFDFVSCVQKDHVMGTQFHPEKSHRFGMELLRGFVTRC
jgi:imidazole glycerol-phosphate synthase subunit HisH